MGDSIDTGQGGFDVNGQTYVYDVGLPEDKGGAQGPYKDGVDVSAGYVDSTGAPKDLTTKTKMTLSQYLSDQTSGKGKATPVANDYPVDAGYKALATTTKTGKPALQTPGGGPPVNTKAFAPGTSGLSSLSDSFSKLSGFRKGKSDLGTVGGNDLLPGIPGNATLESLPGLPAGLAPPIQARPVEGHPDASSVIEPYVSAVLQRNRFSAGNTQLQAPGLLPTQAPEPSFTRQQRLGAYDRQAPTVLPDRLAQVGSLLTMRASRELLSTDSGKDPNSVASLQAALLPGLAQLGVTKVDSALLYASDVLSGLADVPLDPAFVLKFGNESWGALNNVADPFSGTDALGMLALSLALVAALQLLIDGISALLGLIVSQGKKPTHDALGRYSLGEYYSGEKQTRKAAAGGLGGAAAAVATLNFGALLGIQPTNYPFNQALSVGTNAFFGVETDAGFSGQLLGILKSSVDSPGFNVVVIRAIIRSGITIVEHVKGIGGNFMNAVSQILSLMDVIRESKIIAACNVFATLGDALLSLPKEWIDPDAVGGLKVSQVDQVDNSLANAANKSRLKGGLKLAWASNRAPANLLLPASIVDPSVALADLGQYDALLGARFDSLSRVGSVVTSEGTNRIDPAAAAAFEAGLDAEYVPFYFHDLRTNEMVSFHAFLASMSDDYTASYERSEGFGRVEPVKTYRGTERRIGMSFYVVSTSPQDFDEMWVKINKLVTLVYPQFTKGIQLSSGDGTSYRFTQPFSQLIGASPMIRLRLGDLLRSNYSRFGLARLFGLGNADFTVNKQQAGKPKVDAGTLERYSSVLKAALTAPKGETYLVAPGSYPFIDPTTGGTGPSGPPVPALGSSTGPAFAPTFSPQRGLPGMLTVQAMSVDPASVGNPAAIAAGNVRLVCKVQLNDDPAYKSAFSKALAAATSEFGNGQKPLQNVIGGTYAVPVTALTPTRKTKKLAFQAVAPTQDGMPFSTELSAFLATGGATPNAIARSFADTGGKGLAGFIETLSFDWYDKATWETTPDRVAPQICKVTMVFSPIHDITPGLDHLGFNRAPVYPVGVLAQGPGAINA